MARPLYAALLLSLLSLFTASAAYADSGSVEFMDFAHLHDQQQVGNFYNGGGGAGVPNFGVTFSSNVYGLRSAYAPVHPGAGNFSPDRTSTPAIFINGPTGSMATGTMNVSAGFSNGISFFYTSAFTETVTIWSGANGTGTVLATMTLSASNAPGACAGGPAYCVWTGAGISFSGVAKSVTISGAANGIGISDITLGQSTTAIPEPPSIYLFGAGLLAITFMRVRSMFLA